MATEQQGEQQRENRGRGERGGREGRGRGEGRGRRDREEKDSDLIDKLVHINRVAKVVKGGRRFGFAALVVVGDGDGRVGYGHGKAREVPEAIRKATDDAKKSLIRIPLKDGRTIHHEVRGHHGAGKVLVRPAPAGTGIIAGGPMRAVFEALGVGDVVSKSLGTSNPYNMVRATFDALKNQQSPRMVAQRRGRSVSEILARREDQTTAEVRLIQGKREKSWPRRKRKPGKTVTVRQIRSANRKPDIQAATLRGLGLGKIRRTRTLEDTPAGAWHDQRGQAPRRESWKRGK